MGIEDAVGRVSVPGALSKQKLAAETANSALNLRQPSFTENLEMRLEHHEAEAAKLRETIAAIKSSPDVERILNLIQRL